MAMSLRGILLQTVDWGLRMLDESSAFKLREAERTAKQQRIGQWVNWTPPATPSSKLTGTVTVIVSGDCIVVADSESGTSSLSRPPLPLLTTTHSSQLSRDFRGTVTEIVSGGCTVVADSELGESLSKAPMGQYCVTHLDMPGACLILNIYYLSCTTSLQCTSSKKSDTASSTCWQS